MIGFNWYLFPGQFLKTGSYHPQQKKNNKFWSQSESKKPCLIPLLPLQFFPVSDLFIFPCLLTIYCLCWYILLIRDTTLAFQARIKSQSITDTCQWPDLCGTSTIQCIECWYSLLLVNSNQTTTSRKRKREIQRRNTMRQRGGHNAETNQ